MHPELSLPSLSSSDQNKQISSLPSHIISQILHRLSTKDVLRCKCACKQWYDLIREPYFVIQHMDFWWRFVCVSENQYVPGGNYSHGSQSDEDFQVISECYGIGVERSHDKGDGMVKYRARNPATRQILDLPNPQFTTNHQIAICYNKKTGLCKLISIYFHERETNRQGGCEIITVGSDSSWRKLEIPSLNDIDKEKELIKVNMITPDCQAFHLTRVKSSLAEIVSISLEDESVFINTLPEGAFSNLENVRGFISYPNLENESESCCWKAKPGFAEVVNKKLHVIRLVDFRKNEYSRRITVPLKFMEEEEEEQEQEAKKRLNPLRYKGGEYLFTDDKEVFAYNPITRKKYSLGDVSDAQERRRSFKDRGDFSTLLTFNSMQKQH